MTETEWLATTCHSQSMAVELRRQGKVTRTKLGRRKLRLLACGCCRLVWDLLQDRRLREAVEVAERFAEGNASKEELETVRSGLLGYRSVEQELRVIVAADLARDATSKSAFDCAFSVTATVLPLAGYTSEDKGGEEILCDLFRCVFGNPFRPVTVDRRWLTWNDGTIPRLARAIYDERRFQDLPVLADALEEAGCTTPDLLDHCHQQGPHIRGCWVVDQILERK